MFVETVDVDRWSYVVGIGILLSIWGVFYYQRSDLRRRMLVVSLGLMPASFLGQYFFLKDYWNPPAIGRLDLLGANLGSIIDPLFAFAMAGIAVAAFPVLMKRHKRYSVSSKYKAPLWFGLAFIASEGGCVITLTRVMHVNSILSSMLGFVLCAGVVVLVRRDLLGPSLVSGVASALALGGAEFLLSFVVPLYLSRYWLLYHTGLGLLVLDRVPLTEVLWGLCFGLAIGPLYDAMTGLTFHASHASAHPPKRARVHGEIDPIYD